MAGYFTKNNGYVYNGEDDAVSAVDVLKSGQFVEVNGADIVLASAAKAAGYSFNVVEVTEYDGKPAVRADVLTVGDAEIFMVEHVSPSGEPRDEADNELIIKKGNLVRKRRPGLGDQILVTVSEDLSVTVGDK